MSKKDQKVISIGEYLKQQQQSKTEISRYSMTNILSIVNKGTLSYYNLCKTFNFKNLDKLSTNQYSYYIVKTNDTWTGLSYKFYRTIDAWWILCKFNQIKNPFQKLKQSTIIKIPSSDIVNTIIMSFE